MTHQHVLEVLGHQVSKAVAEKKHLRLCEKVKGGSTLEKRACSGSRIHIRTHKCVYIIHTCMYLCVCVYIYIYVLVCMCVYVHNYAHMCVCMFILYIDI